MPLLPGNFPVGPIGPTNSTSTRYEALNANSDFKWDSNIDYANWGEVVQNLLDNNTNAITAKDVRDPLWTLWNLVGFAIEQVSAIPTGTTGVQGFQGRQGLQGLQGNQGRQGIQGFQGRQGHQGRQGIQGNQGWQGFAGSTGFQGAQGYQGYQGVSQTGPQGIQGFQGLQGLQGNQGRQGSQGFQGLRGPIGIPGLGVQGYQGIQGWQGYQGDQGWQGYQGYQGTTGQQGFQGYQGLQGRDGFAVDRGDTGFQGFQGYQGTTGYQGFQGNQGFQGRDGFAVDRGDTGFQGFQGYQGLTGSAGLEANVYTWKMYDDVDQNPSSPGFFSVYYASYTGGPIITSTFDYSLITRIKIHETSSNTVYLRNFLLKATPGSVIYFRRPGQVTPVDEWYFEIITNTLVLSPAPPAQTHFILEVVNIGSPNSVLNDFELGEGSTEYYVGFDFVGNEGPTGPQGFQGFQGNQGWQGWQGRDGAAANIGDTGPQGYQGYQGFQGNQGYQGWQGFGGSTGVQGYQGWQGFVGFTGSQGYQGFQGFGGSTGVQGYQGPQGYQGSQGFQGFGGSTGVQGYQGWQGFVGFTGSQGFQGWQGFNGLTGSQGYQGWQGFVGLTGSQGFQGWQGFGGSTGSQGWQGFQGLQGLQGFQGNQGNQGWQGFVGSTGLQGYQGFQGWQGFQGNQGFQGFQGWQGLQGNQGFQGWQGFGGSTGSQGYQGFQGFQGWQGLMGSTGFQGFQGFQGNQGFQGWQGFGGSTGSQGFQGFQGNQGSQGNQGFQGFQGNQGFQGWQGLQGFQGNQGFQGWQGFGGSTGSQGFQGWQGFQGFQGYQGYQGYQGWQGPTGPQQVLTGRQIWIDSVYGDDLTGTPDRFDLPFLGLTAAQFSATAGDVINIRPGTYVTTGKLGKNGVDWSLSEGVTIICTQSTAIDGYNWLFGDYDLEQATFSAMYYNVSGFARLISPANGSGVTNSTIYVRSVLSELHFNDTYISLNNGLPISNNIANGNPIILDAIPEQVLEWRRDDSFNSGIGSSGSVWSILYDEDSDRIYAAGSFDYYNDSFIGLNDDGFKHPRVVRLFLDGSRDFSFNESLNQLRSYSFQVDYDFPSMVMNDSDWVFTLTKDGDSILFGSQPGVQYGGQSAQFGTYLTDLRSGNFWKLTNGQNQSPTFRSEQTSFRRGPNNPWKIKKLGDYYYMPWSQNRDTWSGLIKVNSTTGTRSTFGQNGVDGFICGSGDSIWDLDFTTSSNIVIVGDFLENNFKDGGGATVSGLNSNYLVEIDQSGNLIATFSSSQSFDDKARCIYIFDNDNFGPTGSMIIGGDFTTYGGTSSNRIIKLNPDYSINTTFDIGSGFDGSVECLKLDNQGNILVGGSFTSYKGDTNCRYLVRLDSSTGDLIDDFNTIGSSSGSFNGTVRTIEVQPDDRILVGGDFTTFNGESARRIIRLGRSTSIYLHQCIVESFVERESILSLNDTLGSVVYSYNTYIDNGYLGVYIYGNITVDMLESTPYLQIRNIEGARPQDTQVLIRDTDGKVRYIEMSILESQGPTGFQGITGLQGNQGLQGLQGFQGITGFQGNQGRQGLQGFQGLEGNQGWQGPTDQSVFIASNSGYFTYSESTIGPWIGNSVEGWNGGLWDLQFATSSTTIPIQYGNCGVPVPILTGTSSRSIRICGNVVSTKKNNIAFLVGLGVFNCEVRGDDYLITSSEFSISKTGDYHYCFDFTTKKNDIGPCNNYVLVWLGSPDLQSGDSIKFSYTLYLTS